MKRFLKYMVSLSLSLSVFFLTSCSNIITNEECEHIYTEATCITAKTCSICGKTSGYALGHSWQNATCTSPKTCSTCKTTQGKALGHTYTETNMPAPKMCSRCNKEAEDDIAWYKASTYKVGADIPAGEYYIKCTSTYMAYFAISSDSSDNSIIENENFYGHHFVTLENGQYFTITRSQCTAVKNITLKVDLTDIEAGMYRVGTDIPAGEYKVVNVSTSSAYFAVYDNSKATRKIRKNDNFEGSEYITVYSGEYLYLKNCKGLLVEEKESTPVDDKLWSYTEVTTLLSKADSANTYAKKAFAYTVEAMSSYQAPKIFYYQNAVLFVKFTKDYLVEMKVLAENNAELTLTNSNEKYKTLREKIVYAYNLCNEIAELEITSSNYSQYANKIQAVSQELALECLGIFKISSDMLIAFVSL